MSKSSSRKKTLFSSNHEFWLENSNCLELIKKIPDNSVGQVNADPPYFIGFDGGKGWDSQWSSDEEYLKWCQEWISECWRVLRPGRCMYVWGTTKTDAFLRLKLEVLNKLPQAVYQNWIIWSYDWGGRTKKTFARKHEDCLMFSKGKDFLFNADDVRIPYIMEKNVRADAKNNPLGKIPTDVWQKNNHTTSKEYVGWHPTQKPIELLSRMIKANTEEGEIVLDPFSGSGSTAIAAINANRAFVGAEIDPVYFQKSLERIKNLTKKNI